MAKEIYVPVDQKSRKGKKIYVPVSGKAAAGKKGYISVGGVARPFWGDSYIPLSAFEEGSVVTINENGSPAEFYVAQHDYQSSLNGAGKTLLVRKDIYSKGPFGYKVEEFYGSTAYTFLNSTYKSVLDDSIQDKIVPMRLMCYVRNTGVYTERTMELFLLGSNEIMGDDAYETEGEPVAKESKLKVAYYNDTASDQWTRTPYMYHATISPYYYAIYLDAIGKKYTDSQYVNRGYRPAFALPGDTLVSSDGHIG